MLVITLGYPSAGASTWAARFHGKVGIVVIDRRNLRLALLGTTSPGDESQERLLERLYWSSVSTALGEGLITILPDRHLNAKRRNATAQLARKHGVPLMVVGFIDVPGPENVLRDHARHDPVGTDVIMAARAEFTPARLMSLLPAGCTFRSPNAAFGEILAQRQGRIAA